MAKQELWRGEAAERYRIMDAMEEDRAARERHALRDADPRVSNDEEYRRRLDEQRGAHGPQQSDASSHRGPGPKGYQGSDDRILEDLNERGVMAVDRKSEQGSKEEIAKGMAEAGKDEVGKAGGGAALKGGRGHGADPGKVSQGMSEAGSGTAPDDKGARGGAKSRLR